MMRFCTTLLITLLLLTLPAAAHARAGHFLFVYGKVSVTAGNGTLRQAAKGMAIEEGETITSGVKGAAQLRMEDGAFLAIRPNTVLKIDTYAYKEKGREEQSTLSLLKGTFRAITGEIGKKHPKKDLVKTPVATIGIRGTDHEPAYIPPPAPGQTPSAPPGAYDKVNKGATFMQTDAGRLDLGPNQIGHAMAPNKKPVTLPSMPAFYKTPDKPAVKEQKKEDEGDNDKGKGTNNKSGKGNSDKADNGDTENNASNNSGTEDDNTTTDSGNSDTNPGGTSATSTTDNDDSVTTTSGSLTTTSTKTTVNSTTTGDQNVTRTYSASSESGQTVDLTQQTTTSNGTTSSISTTTTTTTPTITYATPAAKSSSAVSWVGVPSGQSFSNSQSRRIDGMWGDTLTQDASGNITGWKYTYYNGNDPAKDISGSVSGIVGTPQPTQANSYATTGITFGSYNANQITLTSANNTTSTETLTVNSVSLPFNWITGTDVSPFYLPQVYQGSASFSYDGGIATDETGATATLSGSISLNFASQAVGVSLNAVTNGGGKWIASASNVPLNWNSFNVADQSQPSPLSVSYCMDNTCTYSSTGNGNIDGALTGSGMTGIVSAFAFNAADPITNTQNHTLVGVAAFANTASTVNSTIDHRVVAFASYDPRTNLANTYFTQGVLGVFANNTSDITYDTGGTGITVFKSTLPLYYSTTYTDQNGNTQTGYNSNPVPVKMAYTGTVTDVGTDSVTGISWGRWTGGGNLSTALTGSQMPTFNPPELHYIAGPTTNQSVQLPTSGTFSYTLAGNTSPTDNLGNQAGTLNSATLKANFTNMTVDMGIKATVGGTTLSATGSALPIQGTYFHAGDKGGPALTVNCSGTCSAVNDGQVGGTFTGTTGNGAAVVYSLGTHASGAVGTEISGVAAFHR